MKSWTSIVCIWHFFLTQLRQEDFPVNPYYLDESISNFRIVGWEFSLCMHSYSMSLSIKRMLGLYGFNIKGLLGPAHKISLCIPYAPNLMHWLIFLLFLHKNICYGAHWNHLKEMLQMSTHNLCIKGEVRKIIGIPLLSKTTDIYNVIRTVQLKN